MKIFKDRVSAGKLLAKHLKQYESMKNGIVLAIPRGGVVVAKEVAEELKLPLDIIITRKIGHPNQPELAVGAIDPDGEIVWDREIIREFGDLGEVGETMKNEMEEIRRREQLYRGDKRPIYVEGKTVILVDDGIATGATTLAAINYLKRHKAKKIILATPVASKEAISRVLGELGVFGEAMVLETPEDFSAVGQFYQSFEPVEDKEVIELLKT